MPPAGAQISGKKQIAIKHADGEPLTRSDLQYDLLYYLFSDQSAVFTDPHATLKGGPPGSKVTFRDLYVNTLVHSPRCSKVSQNKLLDNPQFADEFAKISLLSNINRINTTMAFFPEMRTTLRTYHPVPSLQKTEGNNLQDAPRIKNILKFCLLPNETQDAPATTADVLERMRSGVVPTTSIVNLIFIFQNYSSLLAQAHFPPSTPFELQDFFTPINISSESRARAFLWLCYHYYEGSTPNPFGDTYSEQHPGMIPKLYPLSREEALLENVDTAEEKAWGKKMTDQRRLFLSSKDKLSFVEDLQPINENRPSVQTQKTRRGRGGRGHIRDRGHRGREVEGHSTPIAGPSTTAALPVSSSREDSSFRGASPTHNSTEGSMDGETHELPRHRSHPRSLPHSQDACRSPPTVTLVPSPSPELRSQYAHHAGRRNDERQSYPLTTEPYPSRRVSSHNIYMSHDGGVIRHSRHTHRDSAYSPQPVAEYTERSPSQHSLPLAYRDYNPSQHHHVSPHPQRDIRSVFPLHEHYMSPPLFQPRTMLEQAWHVVRTTDPLTESDEQDENTRLDLSLRLKIISRLRGKEPTPEPDPVRVREAQAMVSDTLSPAKRKRSFAY